MNAAFVQDTGSWIFRYAPARDTGRVREIGLGSSNIIDLASRPREGPRAERRTLARGEDPEGGAR